MQRMKTWALVLSTAVLFGGGCSSSFGNSTIAITAVEIFDIGLGVLTATLLQGAGLAT